MGASVSERAPGAKSLARPKTGRVSESIPGPGWMRLGRLGALCTSGLLA
jgi:hypothetical protein